MRSFVASDEFSVASDECLLFRLVRKRAASNECLLFRLMRKCVASDESFVVSSDEEACCL